MGPALHRVALAVDDAHAPATHLAHVAFLEEDEVARHGQQRSDVRGDEVLLLAEADHHRAAFTRDDDAVRVGLRDDGERIRALELRHGRPHGLEQVAGHPEVVVDAVRDHFGVGFGGEHIAFALRLRAQFLVVLDDAVVDDRDAVLRDVRMGVALARAPVRRPTRVRDAEAAMSGIGLERVLQLADLADGAQALDGAGAVQHGDARRVVAPVLQPPQALDQDRDDVTVGDGSNDSAHAAFLGLGGCNCSPRRRGPTHGPSHGLCG